MSADNPCKECYEHLNELKERLEQHKMLEQILLPRLRTAMKVHEQTTGTSAPKLELLIQFTEILSTGGMLDAREFVQLVACKIL